MADISQTLTPTQGTDGRVKIHAASPIVVAGITSWKRAGKAAVMRTLNFESSADVATGLVQANILRGAGENTVQLSGIVNLNTTDQTETGTTGITNGAYVYLDLLGSKTLGKGYANVPGYISSFELGQEVENKVFLWSATLDVDGVFPTWGTVP